jgi:hypothetical protein
MCSQPALQKAVSTTARVVSGVTTLGTSEIARNNLPASNVINQALRVPGRLVTGGNAIPTTATALGIVKPEAPPMPQTPTPSEPEPTPTFMAPNVSETSAMRRRRRLLALRGGINSTIRTSARGATDTANLLTPQAGGTAAALKKTLGS